MTTEKTTNKTMVMAHFEEWRRCVDDCLNFIEQKVREASLIAKIKRYEAKHAELIRPYRTIIDDSFSCRILCPFAAMLGRELTDTEIQSLYMGFLLVVDQTLNELGGVEVPYDRSRFFCQWHEEP